MKKGSKMSPESCAKISAAKRGKSHPPHSVETRKKISDAKKGKSTWTKGAKFSDAHRAAISRANKGRVNTPEQIAKMIAAKKGIKLGPLSEAHKEKIGNANRGERNASWKGGVTSLYRTIRKSPRYKAWRLVIFERDNYTCILCETRGGTLHADHIQRFAEHPELRFDINNGRTLCVPCHKKTPTYGGKKQNATPPTPTTHH